MNKETIILIGGGGHCKSVIDVIETEGRFQIAGIIDQKEMRGTEIMGYQIIGSDDDIEDCINRYKHFHITVGHISSNEARVRLYKDILSKGGFFPSIISPTAYVSQKNGGIGQGTIIMHHAVINSGAIIGENCIINTCAIIEHDAQIKDYCHISTGAAVNGECVIGEHSFIGSNATIIQTKKIAAHNIIAAGAVVLNDTQPNSLYAGNPATLKKQIQ